MPETETSTNFSEGNEEISSLDQLKDSLLADLKSTDYRKYYEQTGTIRRGSVSNDTKRRKEEIENDGLEQDNRMKRKTLYVLFLFLALETAVIFILSMWQGFELWGFELDKWSFRILITATLGQITYMIKTAVQHLFPVKK